MKECNNESLPGPGMRSILLGLIIADCSAAMTKLYPDEREWRYAMSTLAVFFNCYRSEKYIFADNLSMFFRTVSNFD